jgi:Na+/H+ antiporter NhaD/arsenite permease-like protein
MNHTWPLVASLGVAAVTSVGLFVRTSDRTIVALGGASAMIVLGSWLSFYDVHAAISAVDFDTITLLLGMMLLVGLLRETGLFEFLALRVAKLARGRPMRLLVYLGVATAAVSMLIDNVTTMFLLLPVTVSLADLLGLPAFPFVVTGVTLANVGGVATLIGDPSNAVVGFAAGLGFLDFITCAGPITVLIGAAAMAALVLLFRAQLTATEESSREAMCSVDARRAIVDPAAMHKMLIVLAGMVLLFFLHEVLRMEPGWVALFGACAALLWVRPDFDDALKQVRWDLLLLLIGLFVVVGGLDASGALGAASSILAGFAERSPGLAAVGVLWGSALASAFVDRIPLAVLGTPVLAGVVALGVAAEPLWWAFILGLGFGRNLTPLGSGAGIALRGLSDSVGEGLAIRQWARSGTFVALLSCILATVALLFAVRFGLL